MDKLDEIFALQAKLDSDIIKRRGLEHIGMEEWIQREVLALMSELAELIDEVNFKWWKNKKDVDMDAVKGELVDILHFFTSMCLKVGMTPGELFEISTGKTRENFDRQTGLSSKTGYDVL